MTSQPPVRRGFCRAPWRSRKRKGWQRIPSANRCKLCAALTGILQSWMITPCKILSVRQPWAHLTGDKRIENRSWTTPYRGPLLIHRQAVACGEDRGYRTPARPCRFHAICRWAALSALSISSTSSPDPMIDISSGRSAGCSPTPTRWRSWRSLGNNGFDLRVVDEPLMCVPLGCSRCSNFRFRDLETSSTTGRDRAADSKNRLSFALKHTNW